MAIIGNLVIGMGVNTRDFGAKMKQAGAQLQALEASALKTRATLASFGSTIGKMAVFGGGAAIAGGISAFIKASQAGSDLNEQISKSKVVFGDAAGQITSAANEMAKAFGVSKIEFTEGAINLGQLGKAAGLAKPEAAKLGTEMSKLAVDVSSLQNFPVQEVLQSMRSGLAGEAEPMRKFGVFLSEAAVNSQAAAMGFRKVNNALTEGQKVQARAALIMKGLSDAIGDRARTDSGYANTTKAITGRIQNMWTDVGAAIQPVSEAVATFASSGLRVLQEEIDANQASIAAWASKASESGGLVSQSFAGLGRSIAEFTDFMQNANVAWLAFKAYGQGAIASVGEGLARIGDYIRQTIELLTGAKSQFGDTLQAFAEDMRRTANESKKALEDAAKQGPASLAVRKAFGKAGAVADKALANKPAAGKTGPSVDDIAKSAKFTSGLEAAAKQMDALRRKSEAMADAGRRTFEETRSPLEKYLQKITELKEQLQAGAINQDTFNRAAGMAQKELGGQGGPETRKAGALQLGSQEAYSAIVNAQSPDRGDPQKAVVEVGNKQLDAQRQAVVLLRQMAGQPGAGLAGGSVGLGLFNF